MIIVVLNIPLALLGSIVILNLTGNTINIMTLGGLALAIGILVDEATVEIENIHTQMEHTPSMSRAVRQGNMETAVPRLLALLCILSVFIPSFIMEGAVRALFVPLSLAVGGAMITSYLLSSTFVPVLCVWLLENRHGTHGHGGAAEARPGFFVRMQDRFERVVDWTVAHRRKVVLAYLLATGAVVVRRGRPVGPRAVPEGRHRPVPAPRAAAAGDPVRADHQGGPEDARRDRRGGRARQRRHHDGLRRRQPAAVHDQHGLPLEPRARRQPAPASACAKGAESISSSCRSGCARSCPRRSARGSARSS